MLFWGFGGQHVLNMGPTWGPRGLPKSRKIYKKKDYILYVVFDWFFIDFGSLLGGFLEVMLALKIDKKMILTGNTEKSDFLILA